jgi:hypothetical protein
MIFPPLAVQRVCLCIHCDGILRGLSDPDGPGRVRGYISLRRGERDLQSGPGQRRYAVQPGPTKRRARCGHPVP